MSQLLPVVGPGVPAPDDSTNSLITVLKVRLKDHHLLCEFIEQRSQEAPPRIFALTCAEQVHPDLLHTFSRLVPHLCLLTEQLTETPDFWPDEAEELPARFEAFSVTGFSTGKAKTQSGVTLIGQRTLAGGKVLNLTGPHVSFEDETDAAYAYAGLLETAVQLALTEVEAALRGKCTDFRQLDLFERQPTPAQVLVIPTPAAA